MTFLTQHLSLSIFDPNVHSAVLRPEPLQKTHPYRSIQTCTF